jgi:hypothetical protein
MNRKQYGYTHLTMKPDETVETALAVLNQLGARGWQVLHMNTNPQAITVFLMREVLKY